MRRFYQNRAGAHTDVREGHGSGMPMSYARALREATSWLRSYRDSDGRRPFAHPVYWAGFYLLNAASDPEL